MRVPGEPKIDGGNVIGKGLSQRQRLNISKPHHFERFRRSTEGGAKFNFPNLQVVRPESHCYNWIIHSVKARKNLRGHLAQHPQFIY